MTQIESDFDQLDHSEQLRRLGELAGQATGLYDLPGDVTVEMINLSENATYKVTRPGASDQWALRVHRAGYHSDAAIASELAWVQALRQDGAAVTPVPIPGKDGELIQKAAHDLVPGGRRVVLFEWEAGSEPSEADHNLGEWFETLGETTAHMHRHVHAWQKPAGFERLTWDFETSLGDRPHWGRWRDGMGMTAEAESLIGQTCDLIARRLEGFGKGPERFGLIHCDMRLANLLIDGDASKVIDFDDCGFSWLMYDCATTVSFFEHEPQVPDLIRAWVKGYRRIAELPADDEAEIPTFVMLRRLLLVAWIGSHSETELAQDMGVQYTQDTLGLCRNYMKGFG
ncbi:MAG: phosphotransferase enzyme family protein [Pseudomonadota bacterium]